MDSKLLVRALIELNIARKNTLSYPEGHHQVAASTERAFRHLRAFLDQSGRLDIGVSREGLIMAGQLIEPANPVLRDLATALRERRIARLEIGERLAMEDARAFLRLLAGSPSPDSPQSAEPPKSTELGAVRVQFIDYSLFHHAPGPAPDGGDGQPSIWQDYVRLLAAGLLTHCPSGSPIAGNTEPTPQEIATLVNRSAAQDHRFLQSYEQVIQSHLRRAVAPGQALAKPEVRERFKQFIDGLAPPLRRQFLSITFEHIQRNAERPEAEAFARDLHHAVILEMLIQANADGKEISPTLVNFLRKMAASGAWEGSADDPDAAARLRQEIRRIQALAAERGALQREAYEAYVTSDYDRTLQALIPHQGREADDRAASPDLAAHLESLGERSLVRRLAQAFLGMLKQSPAPDLFAEHARNLTLLAEDLARWGEADLLLQALQVLEPDGPAGLPEGVAETARRCREALRGAGVIDALLDAIARQGRPPTPTQLELAVALGPAAAHEVLSRYLASRQPAMRSLLVRVAAAHPQRIAAEIARRLRATAAAPISELLEIAAMLDPERVAELLAPFLDQGEHRIRQEVLTLLVRQRHPAALRRLETLLASRNPSAVAAAASLVTRYAVADMVPAMMRILRRGVLMGKADLERAEKIIAAVRRVAVPFPAAEIAAILDRKLSLFHPRRLGRLRREVAAAPVGREPRSPGARNPNPAPPPKP